MDSQLKVLVKTAILAQAFMETFDDLEPLEGKAKTTAEIKQRGEKLQQRLMDYLGKQINHLYGHDEHLVATMTEGIQKIAERVAETSLEDLPQLLEELEVAS